jgi:hypothetical protein
MRDVWCSTSGTSTSVGSTSHLPAFLTAPERNSTYHGLQLGLKKRFGAGYSILSSYTWSKFIDMVADDGHGSTTATATNPFNWFLIAASDNYVHHRFPVVLGNCRSTGKPVAWRRPCSVAGNSTALYCCRAHALQCHPARRAAFPAVAEIAQTSSAPDPWIIRRAVLRPVHAQVLRYFPLRAAGPRHLGTAGRNILQGPGTDVDMSMFKAFPASNPVAGLPLGGIQPVESSHFGNPSGNFIQHVQSDSAKDPRIMQVGLKFLSDEPADRRTRCQYRR